MKSRILMSTAALLGLLPGMPVADVSLPLIESGKPVADVSLPLIEYRVLGSIGQVRLTTGLVHDPATQKAMLSSLASFDQQGLILVAGESLREFRRRETIGSHSVETIIHVYPATGRGYRGGLATADVIVMVDGKQRVDSPFISGSVELTDVGIMPVDGLISVSGSYDDKHIGALLSLNGGQTIDLPWLQRNGK
jgi:hypothetical protein